MFVRTCAVFKGITSIGPGTGRKDLHIYLYILSYIFLSLNPPKDRFYLVVENIFLLRFVKGTTQNSPDTSLNCVLKLPSFLGECQQWGILAFLPGDTSRRFYLVKHQTLNYKLFSHFIPVEHSTLSCFCCCCYWKKSSFMNPGSS